MDRVRVEHASKNNMSKTINMSPS